VISSFQNVSSYEGITIKQLKLWLREKPRGRKCTEGDLKVWN